jgi:hypothetical protein
MGSVDFFFLIYLILPALQYGVDVYSEMSTRNLPGGKEWTARKAGNIAAIREPIV